MDPTYTFDITSLVGILLRIAEFAHQLLIMDRLPYPLLQGVASHICQHQQHIQPGPCCHWFFL